MSHVIITTANIPEQYERRKQQYIDSIETCLKYSHLFNSYTVLECVSEKEEYLDQYNTVYSTEGNLYPNKGLNELNHLRVFLEGSTLKDSEPIIKLSGKYIIDDSYFFEKVIELQHKFDSIFKNDDDVFEGNGYHTFFYCLKKRLFLDTINSIDFSLVNDTPIEWDIKNYLMVMDKHIEIDRLGITAYQGANSERIFTA
ncbi:hypothetical protein [Mucilaginibacter sp.]|uniref:hypothetical protein n=1 Tax=Mucilaginibacter sp. TaxID=1882438 RepID=UPI0025E16A60|nr:hypothetical protein [Mucilaginibacter sp.]